MTGKIIRLTTTATALFLHALPALATVAAMQATSTYLVQLVQYAAVIIIIIAGCMLASGRATVPGLLFLAVGIGVAANPEDIASLWTG